MRGIRAAVAAAMLAAGLRAEAQDGVVVFARAFDGILSVGAGDGNERSLSKFGEQPDTSRDGKRIAFQAMRDGNYEIFVMDSDGSNATRITTSPAGEVSPAWSPDGRRIAFVRITQSGTETDPVMASDICVIDADGSNLKVLTGNKTDEWSPCWSPDGSKIAFNSREGGSKVCVMDADGSNVRILAEAGSDPAWSPDGKEVAFTSTRDDGHFNDLYVMKADGGEARRLTTTGEEECEPCWSPDGKSIAFSRLSGGVFVIGADGGDPKCLTRDGSSPAWLPAR